MPVLLTLPEPVSWIQLIIFELVILPELVISFTTFTIPLLLKLPVFKVRLELTLNIPPALLFKTKPDGNVIDETILTLPLLLIVPDVNVIDLGLKFPLIQTVPPLTVTFPRKFPVLEIHNICPLPTLYVSVSLPIILVEHPIQLCAESLISERNKIIAVK